MKARWTAGIATLLMVMIPTAPAAVPPVVRLQPLDIATEAYIYRYPLVTMEMTRRVMTNVQSPTTSRAPMGQFHRVPTYPDASFHNVTTPSVSTLCSAACLDVSKERYVPGFPDARDRYYRMPMRSAWTGVFANPGKRTTGTRLQCYIITGPDWKGKVSEGPGRIVTTAGGPEGRLAA